MSGKIVIGHVTPFVEYSPHDRQRIAGDLVRKAIARRPSKSAGDECPLCHGRQKRPVGRSSTQYANCTNCDGAGKVVRTKEWRPCEPCKEEG